MIFASEHVKELEQVVPHTVNLSDQLLEAFRKGERAEGELLFKAIRLHWEIESMH